MSLHGDCAIKLRAKTKVRGKFKMNNRITKRRSRLGRTKCAPQGVRKRNDRIKSISSLTILVLLGLSLVSHADAGSSRFRHLTDEQIQVCVSEIGRHANDDNASRVVHRIVGLDQRNLEEMEIRVETSVYLKSEGDLAREYRASCIIGTMRDLVRFRIDNLRSS